MAFNFDFAKKHKMVKKKQAPKAMTWEIAKSNSLLDAYPQQVKNWENNEVMGSNGRPKPSNWFMVDDEGNHFISWRISNKPVFFYPEAEEQNGWMRIDGNDVKGELAKLRDAVDGHKFNDQIKEAFNRKKEKK